MNIIRKVKHSKSTAALFAMLLSLTALPAFAAGESAGIIAKFEEYGAEALLIIVAFCVVLWGLTGAGLLKRKG